MILIVSGAQNTGKSTFIGDFLSVNKGFRKSRYDYRDFIKAKGIPLNRKATLSSQNEIFNFVVEALKEESRTGDLVIMDRGPIDALAYTLWLIRHGGVAQDPRVIAGMYAKTVDSLKLTSSIIYAPLCLSRHIKVREDGVRDTDAAYREEIDRTFKNLFLSLGISPHILPEGRKERVVGSVFPPPLSEPPWLGMRPDLRMLPVHYGDNMAFMSCFGWTDTEDGEFYFDSATGATIDSLASFLSGLQKETL